MDITEINEVIKASPAIQIQSKITHLQRRAWNVLLANAYDDLPSTDIYRISVTELMRSLGFDSHNEDYLKETLKALVDCTVEWNVLRKDRKGEWGAAALLASAEIEKGVCTYGFAPHLRFKLYNPRLYTKLNLRLQNQFTSRYALILWEVCFDYFDMARNEGETPFIPLETFRELVGLENDEYPLFKLLNRDVIKPAIKEINELTNFLVEVETKRIGRKIGELKFRITRMREIPTIRHREEEETVPFDIEDLPAIAIKLVKAGVSRKEARRIAEEEWDAVYPNALLDNTDDFDVYVDEKIGLSQHAANLKNVGGFIVKAIQENYQDLEFQRQLEKERERKRASMLENLRKEMYEKRSALIRNAIRANPELLEQAAEHISSNFTRNLLEDYDSVQEAYEVGGMVTGELNEILAEKFCADLVAPVIAMYEAEVERLQG